ncbi:MAG: 4-hydroxy-tetrahydrodipicolinate synthase [Elusimicrobia bacterium]|nr:4-hydroxy-tetrahydrodipicolinate synthase [Elusimicrobiota bacterium]MDE2425349.1 4-hydroxy-tetrahydrodipicolinate synthase [Elusimicrobiota bacterium]
MRLQGCYTALVTPFQKNGRLDETALRRLIDLQLAGGTAGLVPCGSTGESATLTGEEHRRVIELTLEQSQGRVPVIAGIAANSTWKALELSREAESLGADALLLLSPCYNKPTQQGLYEHFRAVARATRLPVVLYNIPGRTAVNVEPSTILRLAADCPNLAAVKEASGSLDQASSLLANARSGFTVLSGDDSLTLPMLSVGARGAISVVSNIAPSAAAELCSSFLSGRAKRARALHLKLFPLVKALFVETNPIPVKAALELMGLCRAQPRSPLTPLSHEHRAGLKRELKAFGLL